MRILDVTSDVIQQSGVSIPVSRRLAQIRTSRADLERVLEEFKPIPAPLRSWVEVVVEDGTLEDDLVERVRALTDGRDFDVLKVLRGRSVGVAGMSAGDATDDEAIESLLDRPDQVFEHLLGEHESLTEDEVAELKAAFAVLMDLDAQSEGGGAA